MTNDCLEKLCETNMRKNYSSKLPEPLIIEDRIITLQCTYADNDTCCQSLVYEKKRYCTVDSEYLKEEKE